MNYLAHLYLADEDPQFLVGSLMGDFVKGRVGHEYPQAVQQGILVHRKIDSYTDAHPLVRRSKQRIRPVYRRYAGILVDIYYDHFLASTWTRYADLPLRDFTRSAYRILEAHYATLPRSMQCSVSRMIAKDLLMSYQNLGGVGRALRSIEGRLRRESHLGEALADLELNYVPLAGDFAAFFPELIAFAQRQREQIRGAGAPGSD